MICGASPVAIALAQFGKALGFAVASAGASEEQIKSTLPDRVVSGYDLAALPATERYVVVATQGQGDETALAAALSSCACYIAFVGSRHKAAACEAAFAAKGFARERLAAVHCPAGLDIGAVTPEEIALSILAAGGRGTPPGASPCRRRGRPDPQPSTTRQPKESSHGHER